MHLSGRIKVDGDGALFKRDMSISTTVMGMATVSLDRVSPGTRRSSRGML